MVVTQDVAVDGQRLAGQWLGFSVLALMLEEAAHVVVALCRFGVVLTQGAAADGQRLLI